MTTLEIPNVGTFDVELWDQGSGKPLLYLHGYERHPGGAGFLRRLAEDRRVLAPEQPGYGGSTGFESFVDVHDVALYHRELVRSWGIDSIDVVGHSLGGMFAAELAVLAPQLVRRLVLVNAYGLWLDEQPTLDPFGAAAEVKAAKWHGEPPAREPSNFTPDPDDPHAAILFDAQNLGSATKFMWPIAERGLRRRLPLVAAPTLVVHGTSDGLLPLSYAEEFVRLVPDARLAPVESAGHYPMVEQEDTFVSLVTDFLNQ
ncbi:alpha/beta hydrolase [Pseudonocardia kongjuensis]|uniref:Alpha/beta hydrolase n=1 Tax=Pseudonocardia kongjuensis TaxID=102227 RepID=A0ABN1XN47_9PSEU